MKKEEEEQAVAILEKTVKVNPQLLSLLICTCAIQLRIFIKPFEITKTQLQFIEINPEKNQILLSKIQVK